jgi:DNA-binding winged helix-turn-helix (wHTH) protein
MATIYSFGPFRLDGESEILFRGAEPTPVGRRAVALLRVLIERPGAPVSKDALIEAAWPGLVVEESNLPVQIAALRKVLGQEIGGEGWIETLPRRGYRFVGPAPTNGESNGRIAQSAPAVRDEVRPPPEVVDIRPPPTSPERRQLSTISCELVCSGLDLEDMARAVQAFSHCVSGTIGPFRGSVVQQIGNTVVAHFGHPVARENDVEQAVHAALAVCTAVEALDVAATALRCRIGIATGLAVVDGTHGGIVSQMSGVAARLQMSTEGGVVIDEMTQRLVGNLFECRDMTPIESGAGAPLRAWHVLQANSTKSRFESLHGAALTPFVGRAQDLAALASSRREATTRLFVVDIAGEPGIGKSRLLHEYRGHLGEDDVLVLRGNCWPDSQQTSFRPFIEVVRRVFRVAADETAEGTVGKLDQGLAFVGLATAENVGLLMNLLGLAPPAGSLDGLDGVLIGLRTRSLLLDLLRERRKSSPIVVLLEDLHWIDHASEELLGRLIADADAPPLLIINTYRVGYQPPWLGHANTAMHRIAPLSADDTAKIAMMRLGPARTDAALVRLIVDKAEGNPLFAEEIANFLIERASEQAGDAAAAPLGTLAPLPASVQSLLMARVDRLTVADKALLQAASVIGRRFRSDLLTAVTDVSGVEVRLAAMGALDLVHADGGSGEFVFKHALVCDALYSGLLSAPRTALHLRIAREIERESEGGLVEVAEILAYHYSRTDQTNKAVEFLKLSAQKSNRLYSLDEAERFARMALAGARAQKADRMDAEIAAILVELSRTFNMMSKWFDLVTLIEPEVEGIKALGDIPQVPIVLDFYSTALFGCCRFRDARREAEHALAVAMRLNDGLAMAHGRAAIIMPSTVVDPIPLPEFERLAEISFTEAQMTGDLSIIGHTCIAIGWNFMHRGLTREGRKWVERQIALGQKHQDPRLISQGHFVHGWLDIQKEDYASALNNGEVSLRTARAPLDRFLGLTVVGVAQVMLGHVAEGIATLERQRAQAAAHNWRYTMSGTDAPMGVAMLLRGDLKRGVRWLEDAIDRFETQQGNRVIADFTRLFLAEFYIALLTGSRKPSLKIVLKNLFFILHSKRIAAARAEELLMRAIGSPMFCELGVVHARIAFNLGLLHQTMKRPDAARSWFDKARTAATAQQAANWLAKIDAAMAAVQN